MALKVLLNLWKNSMKYLLSFADNRYEKALERFRQQAADMNVYDHIITYTENDLDQDFKDRIGPWLRNKGTRGFGYWSWKPQIILQALSKMNDGDLLQYTDAGCHLNPQGRGRLLEYFQQVENSDKGMLVFENVAPNGPLIHDGRPLPEYPESMWCKGDLIDHLEIRDRPDILNSPIRVAGIIFLRKSQLVENLIKRWLDVIYHDFNLINDEPSTTPNEPGFASHKHDQPIFSILSKLENVDSVLSAYEFYYPLNYEIGKRKWQTDWDSLKDFPIHARREIKKKFLKGENK
jgi:hypothetical protein